MIRSQAESLNSVTFPGAQAPALQVDPIDAPIGRYGLGHQITDALLTGDVGIDKAHVAPLGAQRLLQFPTCFLLVRGDDYLRPHLGVVPAASSPMPEVPR